MQWLNRGGSVSSLLLDVNVVAFQLVNPSLGGSLGLKGMNPRLHCIHPKNEES